MDSLNDELCPAAQVDTAEFFFPGEGLSALLVHGLTGTPYEMRYLGERLAGAGIRALGVRLSGHGNGPEELAAATHNDWYGSVVAGLERLRSFGDPTVVIGLSAGAVLGSRLAADHAQAVAGLVMLSPAFVLPFWTRLALRVLKPFDRLAEQVFLRRPSSDIHDGAAREVHPGTRLMPLSAAINLTELSSLTRPKLAKVVQPTLVIHSLSDHVCPYRPNIRLLNRRLGSNYKRTVSLTESFHVISVDDERDRVAREILEFIRGISSVHGMSHSLDSTMAAP
jgi:carboxylesterase